MNMIGAFVRPSSLLPSNLLPSGPSNLQPSTTTITTTTTTTTTTTASAPPPSVDSFGFHSAPPRVATNLVLSPGAFKVVESQLMEATNWSSSYITDKELCRLFIRALSWCQRCENHRPPHESSPSPGETSPPLELPPSPLELPPSPLSPSFFSSSQILLESYLPLAPDTIRDRQSNARLQKQGEVEPMNSIFVKIALRGGAAMGAKGADLTQGPFASPALPLSYALDLINYITLNIGVEQTKLEGEHLGKARRSGGCILATNWTLKRCPHAFASMAAESPELSTAVPPTTDPSPNSIGVCFQIRNKILDQLTQIFPSSTFSVSVFLTASAYLYIRLLSSDATTRIMGGFKGLLMGDGTVCDPNKGRRENNFRLASNFGSSKLNVTVACVRPGSCYMGVNMKNKKADVFKYAIQAFATALSPGKLVKLHDLKDFLAGVGGDLSLLMKIAMNREAKKATGRIAAIPILMGEAAAANQHLVGGGSSDAFSAIAAGISVVTNNAAALVRATDRGIIVDETAGARETLRKRALEELGPRRDGEDLAVEKVAYKWSGKIEGKTPFKIGVVFRGTDVVGGFQEAIETGIMRAPLPEFMRENAEVGGIVAIVGGGTDRERWSRAAEKMEERKKAKVAVDEDDGMDSE